MHAIPSEEWASALAGAIVTHSHLPDAAAWGLRQAFHGATEVRFLLANGEADLMEGFFLLHDGALNTEPLAPASTVPLAQNSAALRAFQEQQLVVVDASTPDRDTLIDWQELHADGRGISWLMAAPLACGADGARQCRLMGAVLVGGCGEHPTVDAQWLQEWACEMSNGICHASVTVMECSLDMLSVIFPPRVLEQLVANAARKTGQVELAEALRQAAPSVIGKSSSWRASAGSSAAAAGGASPATGPSSSRSSMGEGGPFRLGVTSQDHRAQRQQAAALAAVAGFDGSGSLYVVSGGGGSVRSSPFAAVQEAVAGDSPRSTPEGLASPTFEADTVADALQHGRGCISPAQSGALSPSDAAALLRQASRGSVASAVLRQISLQSDLSCLMDDRAQQPASPHNWEVAGFEDILEDDRKWTLERRASMAPERAHSRPQAGTAGLDQCIAAATAAMEEAGGMPAAVHDARRHVAEAEAAEAAQESALVGAEAPHQQQLIYDQGQHAQLQRSGNNNHHQQQQQQPDAPPASCARAGEAAEVAAAAQPPPAFQASPVVRVPWQRKPLMHALSNSRKEAEPAPLLSPRKPSAADSFASADSGSDAGKAAPSPLLGKPPAGAPGGFRSSSYSSSMGSANAPSTLPSDCSTVAAQGLASSAAAAAPQQWDLSFESPVLEGNYKRWLAPYLLRSDTSLGLVHWVVVLTAVARVALQGATTCTLLSLAGVLLMAVPALPACMHPGWWAPKRTVCLAGARLLATLLFAAHIVVLASQPLPPGAHSVGLVEAVLSHSGAVSLFFVPLRFPLAFSLHTPLHLLCLWVLTAGSSLAHMHSATSAGPPMLSLPGVMLSQLLIGFLLSSALVYCREARLRVSFLGSRRAAACFDGRAGKRLPPATLKAAE